MDTITRETYLTKFESRRPVEITWSSREGVPLIQGINKIFRLGSLPGRFEWAMSQPVPSVIRQIFDMALDLLWALSPDRSQSACQAASCISSCKQMLPTLSQDFSAILRKDWIATCCRCFRFAFLSVDLSEVLWIRIWRRFLDPAGSGELRVRNEIEIKLLWQNDDKIFLQYLIKILNSKYKVLQ